MSRKPINFRRRLEDLAWAARQVPGEDGKRLAEELEKLMDLAKQATTEAGDEDL